MLIINKYREENLDEITIINETIENYIINEI